MADTDETPVLSLCPASDLDRVHALRLVSNSVAQQRQTLNRHIIFHPYFLAPTAVLFAVIYKTNADRYADNITILILLTGALMALLSMVSRFTSDYLTEAERIGSAEGLEKYVKGDDKVVVVAKWGGNVIGSAVLKKEEDGKVGVWGWAVELRYRGKGLGKDLLIESIQLARRKWGEDCEIVLAKDNANSFRVPKMLKAFNAPFDKSEARARKTVRELSAKKSSE